MAVGWVANRNGLIASAFAVAALYVYINESLKLTQSSFWKKNILGPLLFAVGISANEFCMGVGAYLLTFELFLAGKLDQQQQQPQQQQQRPQPKQQLQQPKQQQGDTETTWLNFFATVFV